MKEFLKELYDNFPELEKSKENVDKVVYYLKDNKPFYVASDEFKNKLKDRLNNIVALNGNKKHSFMFFALPVFSLLFIVVGFTYYFKDVTFLNDSSNISVLSVDENPISKKQNVDVIEETFIEIGDDLSLKDLKTTINKKDDLLLKNDDELVLEEKKVDLTINKPIVELNIQENINETTIENDDIFDFLEALGENLDENQPFEGTISDVGGGNLKMMGDSSPIIMEDSASFATFEMMNQVVGFEDFCKNNMGTIYEAGDEKICRVDKKECLSSNYVNGVCEFKEIK